MRSVFRHLFGLSGLFFLVICSVPAAFAQEDKTLDSLQLVLKGAKNDSARIQVLLELSEICEIEDILKYATECSTLCEKAIQSGKKPTRFYLKSFAGSLNNTGFYQSNQGDAHNALLNYKRALTIEEKLGDKKEIIIQLNNIANVLFTQGDFSQALEYYFRNLKMQEEIGDRENSIITLNAIGYAYTEQREYGKALDYFSKALGIAKALNSKGGLAQSLHNTGMVYSHLNNHASALDYYTRSLSIYEELHNEFGICNSLFTLGEVYIDMKKYDEAFAYLKRSLEISEKHGYTDLSAQSLFTLSYVLTFQKKQDEAFSYGKRGLELARKTGKVKLIRSGAIAMGRIYKKRKQYKEAYEMLQLEGAMKDSILNETNRKNSIKQELQYEYEKREMQGKLNQERELSRLRLENERRLTKRNIWVYVLISLALILGISIFFLFKFFKQRNIINASRNNELRRKLLLNQMNPHFIFNSVDNIQSLIHNKQDKEAINYLGKFSKLTRQILENSNEEYISLAEELNTIENYLSIQQLLYNNSFAYKVEVDESIDKENVFVPPMLTQPFVENAIKHGLKNKKEGGLVEVKFYMKDQTLFFEVSDNGSGLEEKVQSGHKSMSTRIVTERLNSSAKKPIEIHTKNRIENNEVNGVITTFEIPYICDN